MGKVYYYERSADGQGDPSSFEGTGANGLQSGNDTGAKGSVAGALIGKNKEGKTMRERLQIFDMQIQDARPSLSELSIDKNGFICVPHKTRLTQELTTLLADDEAEIRQVYFPEMEELVRQNLVLADGRRPSCVFAFRAQKFTEDKSRGFLGTYSKASHADYTDIAFRTAWKILSKRGVANAEKMDIVFMNTWQPFMRPAFNDPLILLDWQSVKPGDYMEISRKVEPRKGPDGKPLAYVTELCHNPNHRWYYLSNMTQDEVWIFKQADSRLAGPQPKYTFHTSFNDPSLDPTLPKRRSIATNLICGFEPISSLAPARL